MTMFLFSYRMPKDYVPGAGRCGGQMDVLVQERMGGDLIDMGRPTFESGVLGNAGPETALGGYSIVRAVDLEAALGLAEGCPALDEARRRGGRRDHPARRPLRLTATAAWPTGSSWGRDRVAVQKQHRRPGAGRRCPSSNRREGAGHGWNTTNGIGAPGKGPPAWFGPGPHGAADLDRVLHGDTRRPGGGDCASFHPPTTGRRSGHPPVDRQCVHHLVRCRHTHRFGIG